jgi:hypothetical protein
VCVCRPQVKLGPTFFTDPAKTPVKPLVVSQIWSMFREYVDLQPLHGSRADVHGASMFHRRLPLFGRCQRVNRR